MNDNFEIGLLRSRWDLFLEKYQKYCIPIYIVLEGIINLLLWSWLTNELPKVALGGLSEIGIYDILVGVVLYLVNRLAEKTYEYGNGILSTKLWCFHLSMSSRRKLGIILKVGGGIIIAITSIRILLETAGIYQIYGFSWVFLLGISPFVEMGILGQILTELGKAVHMGNGYNRKS